MKKSAKIPAVGYKLFTYLYYNIGKCFRTARPCFRYTLYAFI